MFLPSHLKVAGATTLHLLQSSPKNKNKAKTPPLIIFIQCCSGGPSQCNKARKGIKLGQEEVKLSLSSADIIMSIENSRKPTNK